MVLNVERFMKVKEMILEEPARIDMGVWKDTTMYGREIAPQCSTVGCICGWAAIIYYMDRNRLGRPRTAANAISPSEVYLLGAMALGLGERDPDDLFHDTNWPEDLRFALDEQDLGTPAYAAVVAQAIDRYLACDGNWDNDKGAV